MDADGGEAPRAFRLSTKRRRPRLGTLQVPCRRRGKTTTRSIATPCLQVTCQRGVVPHLTGHMLDHEALSSLQLLRIPAGDVLDFPGIEGLKRFGRSFAEFTNQQGYVLIGSTHNPLTPGLDGYNGDDYVSVWGYAGRQKVSVPLYGQLVRAAGFDVVVSPANNPARATGLQAAKATARSANHLTCLQTELRNSESAPPLLCAAVACGSDDAEQRDRSVAAAVEAAVQGVCLDGMQSHCAGQRHDTLLAITNALPDHVFRLSSGLTTPEDIVLGVRAGLDVFDAEYAFSCAELGYAIRAGFASADSEEPSAAGSSVINMWSSEFEGDTTSPLVAGCRCYTCTHHTCAYIHHLHVTHEMLALVLLAHHNLFVMLEHLASIRTALQDGTFGAKAAAFLGEGEQTATNGGPGH